LLYPSIGAVVHLEGKKTERVGKKAAEGLVHIHLFSSSQLWVLLLLVVERIFRLDL
jgi:hypothetical protein